MIHTRFASEEDAEVLAAIRVATWNAAYRGLLRDDLLDDLRVDDAHIRMWQNAIVEGFVSGSMVWLAERDGVPLGYAMAGPVRDPSPAGGGELYAIYVLPAEWGGGAAPALLQAAINYLRSEAFGTGVLWVFEGNARARRFYEKHGWRADGTKRESPRWAATEVRYLRSLET